eukprot:scaffold693_cov200-Alexandrium_tamarense.AAC.94
MKVTILYGSATGNAEHIAKDLAASINTASSVTIDKSIFTSADVMEMDQFKKKKLFEGWADAPPVVPPTASNQVVRKHALIVIASTTGNGDAPENASRFIRFIKRAPPAALTTHSDPPLQHVAYAVLALGDTNYDQFCATGKLVDRKLAEWGGTRCGGDSVSSSGSDGGVVQREKFHGLTCADEATGLEGTVEPWLESVLVALGDACCLETKDGGDTIVASRNGEEKSGEEETAVAAATVKTMEEEGSGITSESLSKQVEEKLVVAAAAAAASSSSNGDESKPVPQDVSPSKSVTSGGDATPSSQGVSGQSTVSADVNQPTSVPTGTTATANNSVLETSPTPLFILYGSATGNAEHIAKDLAAAHTANLKNDAFKGYFPSVICCELNDYKKKCLAQWETDPSTASGNTAVKHGVIVVTSTTGNADAPENADRFVRWMKRKSTEPSQPFKHCAYAVLGLGDSNYDVFCAVGKVIDKKLSDLGGSRALPLACADEATGLEETVEPWASSVIQKLAVACDGSKGVAGSTVMKPTSSASKVIPKASLSNEEYTSSAEEKKMEIDDPPAQSTTSSSAASSGVTTIRNLLSIASDAPLPLVENSSLPSIVSRLSSCEFIHDEEVRRSRGESISDNTTISSESSGFHYTLQKPYESTILGARYLTATSTECAERVSKFVGNDGKSLKDDKLINAMDMYEKAFPLAASNGQSTTDEEKLQYDKNGKRVIEMTLSLPDDFTLEYEPGDSVGLVVPNSPQSTNFILAMLQKQHGVLSTQKISVDANKPVTVEDAIRSTIDLCSPMKKKRLFMLSMFATDPDEEKALRLLCGNGVEGGEELFQRYVEDQRRTIVDILEEFPSCQSITLEGLLGCLPAIPPRYYSVCSSPLKEKINGSSHHCLKVAFSVVDYHTPLIPEDSNSRRRRGGLATRYMECLCSSYLSNMASSFFVKPTIEIFPKPTHEFRLPPNLSTPLILVGPGTGIAPFLGFLSQRQAQIASLESPEAAEMASEGTWRGGYEVDSEDLHITDRDARGLNLAVDYMRKQAVGDVDLFFGCRYSNHDWLYQKEVKDFKSMGIVTNAYTAFSRESGKEKMYVQTIMQKNKECGQRVVDMIMNKEASVYVCGDGNAMGRDVQETIVTLLAANMSEQNASLDDDEAKERAVAYVDQMKTSGRFVLDIWS